MTTMKKFAGRGHSSRCVIPTQWLGMCMFAALVAMISTTTATAQTTTPQTTTPQTTTPTVMEAIVRAKMAQADVVQIRVELNAAKAQCGRLKAGGGSSSAVKKLEARIVALETEISRKVGCAAFSGAGEQSFCLATVARVSAETSQKGMETYQAVMQGTFKKDESTETTVSGSGVSTITKKVIYAELTPGTAGGGTPRPCVDYLDATGATAETPGTLRQFKCHDAPRPTEYDGRPIALPSFAPPPPVVETSWPRWAKVVTTMVVTSGVLAVVGAGIGYGLSENSLDPNTGERKDNRARKAGICAGIGGAAGLVIGIPVGFAF